MVMDAMNLAKLKKTENAKKIKTNSAFVMMQGHSLQF